MAKLPLDLDALQARCSALAAGTEAAGPALWSTLFPGAVGQGLETTDASALGLLLPSALDSLPWEMASTGAVSIAARFAVSRRLLGEDGGPPVISVPAASASDATDTTAGGRLRVLLVGVDLPAPAAAALLDGRLAVHSASQAQWSQQQGGTRLPAFDMVVLDAEAASLLPALWSAADAPRAPRLLLLCGASAAVRLACVREAACRGCALLGTDADAAGLIATLLTSLLSGLAVDEAVRRLHLEPGLATATRHAVLYGPADAALVRAGSEDPAPAASLRQVTTLSFDLVDSTRLLHSLGEERYSMLLETFHTTCAAIVRRHGGMPDDPQGDDGVMNYFGHPAASESAAAQAVAAGLAIVHAVRTLEVQVRVGVATGRVAVRHGHPVGVSIHLAARLQTAAAPGSVLVAASTHALLGSQFEFAAHGQALSLKGIPEPTVAHRVVGHRHPADSAAHPTVNPTAFVGRDSELAVLTREWEAVLRSGTRVVQVVGEAGIGKSRLVCEFQRWLAQGDQMAIECRGQPNTGGTAFVALTDTLRRLLDLQPLDSPEQQRRKIAERLPAGMPDGAAVALVEALLGVGSGSQLPQTDNPQRHRARTLAVLLHWFRRALGAQAVCLIVEDAHWLDPSTREFLSRLLADPGDLRMLLVATQRSEAADGWQPPQVHQMLDLRRLTPVDARALARTACGARRLPHDVLRLLAARSDGVPLFIEESVRMALDAVAGDADSLHPLRLTVPATLQDLLMARLDRLVSARPVAQLGATLGREFSESLLQAALEHGSTPMPLHDMRARLHELEAAGLLVRGKDAAAPGWVFKHALVRDTAYQSLWKSDRQRLHRDVAAVLAQRFPALVERQPELLARHQTAAGMDADALVQWELAARRAAASSAHEEAISHIDNALPLLQNQPAGPGRDRTELRLLLLLASRTIATEGYGAGRVERLYARAADLCRVLGDEAALLKVELGLHGWHFMRGDLARAQAIAMRCEATAARSADPMQRLQAGWALALTEFHRGESLAAVGRMDAGLRTYRSDGHRPGAVQDPGVMCLCYSAWAQWELGHVRDAQDRVRRVVALADALAHRFSLGVAHGFACSVHLFCGDTARALDHAERSIAICEEGGFVVWLAHALMMRGRLRCDQGAFEQGMADMDEGFSMWVGTGAVVTLPLYLAMRAEGQALAGRPAQGLVMLAEARALIERTGERYHEAELLRLTGELVWQQAGRAAASASATAESEAWLQRASALAGLQRKHSFGLRTALARARIREARGESVVAAALLRTALAAMPEPTVTGDRLSALEMMRQAVAGSSIGVGDAP